MLGLVSCLSWRCCCPARSCYPPARGFLSCFISRASLALSPGYVSMHRTQLRVQIIRIEILSVVPGDRRESVIQVELREPLPVAQLFELLAVQLVGEIDHAFSSVVELQPNLVVTEIPRIHHVTWRLLVLGHLLWSLRLVSNTSATTPPQTRFCVLVAGIEKPTSSCLGRAGGCCLAGLSVISVLRFYSCFALPRIVRARPGLRVLSRDSHSLICVPRSMAPEPPPAAGNCKSGDNGQSGSARRARETRRPAAARDTKSTSARRRRWRGARTSARTPGETPGPCAPGSRFRRRRSARRAGASK